MHTSLLGTLQLSCKFIQQKYNEDARVEEEEEKKPIPLPYLKTARSHSILCFLYVDDTERDRWRFFYLDDRWFMYKLKFLISDLNKEERDFMNWRFVPSSLLESWRRETRLYCDDDFIVKHSFFSINFIILMLYSIRIII